MPERYLLRLLSLFVLAATAPSASAVTTEWVRQLGTTETEWSRGTSADNSGSVYATGYTYGSLAGPNQGSNDALLIKYSAIGELEWMRQVGTNSGDISLAVSSDGLGHVYISGQTAGSLGGPSAGGASDAFLSKFDASGNLEWCRQAGSTGSDDYLSVSADSLSNIFVSGITTGNLAGINAGSQDGFFRKYNSSGDVQWTRQIAGNLGDYAYKTSADGLGGAYVLGDINTYQPAHMSLPYLRRYDTNGTLTWARAVDADPGLGLTVDGLGNVYAANGGVINKFNSDGAIIWSFKRSGYTIQGLWADSLGDVYAAGSTWDGTWAHDDAFVSKYDADGNILWTQLLGTSAADEIDGVSGDALGNVYISGVTEGSLAGPNQGKGDVFVAKVSPAGAIPGDFTGDGFVDASDYIAWRRGLGTTYAQIDYRSWRANFGQTAGSGASLNPSASVPEPTSLMLCVVGAMASMLRRRALE